MIKLKEIIDGDTFQMYHGGKRWERIPRDISEPIKGRYEGGPGIYFTNSYMTARKYAKGSRVVHLVDIDKNFRDIGGVYLNLQEVITFLTNLSGLKNRKQIISDLIDNAKKTDNTKVAADVLNNLIVNWEAGSGNVGRQIIQFFIDHGIDAAVSTHSNEENWLVVYNPQIIKKVSVIDPSKLNSDSYMLPSVPIKG